MIRFDKLTLKSQEALQSAQAHAQEKEIRRSRPNICCGRWLSRRTESFYRFCKSSA